jgi:hypothetical protein
MAWKIVSNSSMIHDFPCYKHPFIDDFPSYKPAFTDVFPSEPPLAGYFPAAPLGALTDSSLPSGAQWRLATHTGGAPSV